MYGRPIADDYTSLTIDFDQQEDFSIDKFQFPETTTIAITSLNETFNVLPNSIKLKTNIRIIKKPQLGITNIGGKIKFQACNKNVCFPPEEILFNFPIEINKSL